MPFEAIVRFKKTEEGGRLSPPKSGYHPQLQVGEDYTSIIIRLKHAGEEEIPMELGMEHHVLVELQRGSPYQDKVTDGMHLNLYEGSKLVGQGKIIKRY